MKQDLSLLFSVLNFSANKHCDQRRKGMSAPPYINHPIELANVLINEGDVDDVTVIAAAILHDTVEDTETSFHEIEMEFGEKIASIVREVSDDKRYRKEKRKKLQIQNAATASEEAKLVKLADKICNLRDVINDPPPTWDLFRRQEYFDWSKQVIDQLRGTHPQLEYLFDQIYAKKP